MDSLSNPHDQLLSNPSKCIIRFRQGPKRSFLHTCVSNLYSMFIKVWSCTCVYMGMGQSVHKIFDDPQLTGLAATTTRVGARSGQTHQPERNRDKVHGMDAPESN